MTGGLQRESHAPKKGSVLILLVVSFFYPDQVLHP